MVLELGKTFTDDAKGTERRGAQGILLITLLIKQQILGKFRLILFPSLN